jgi:hypothetical protein
MKQTESDPHMHKQITAKCWLLYRYTRLTTNREQRQEGSEGPFENPFLTGTPWTQHTHTQTNIYDDCPPGVFYFRR